MSKHIKLRRNILQFKFKGKWNKDSRLTKNTYSPNTTEKVLSFLNHFSEKMQAPNNNTLSAGLGASGRAFSDKHFSNEDLPHIQIQIAEENKRSVSIIADENKMGISTSVTVIKCSENGKPNNTNCLNEQKSEFYDIVKQQNFNRQITENKNEKYSADKNYDRKIIKYDPKREQNVSTDTSQNEHTKPLTECKHLRIPSHIDRSEINGRSSEISSNGAEQHSDSKKCLKNISQGKDASEFSENKCKSTRQGETYYDYYEDEKNDIEDPEWQKIKNLGTNEERYQQVRDCWQSRTIPNPNRNLTYHSFRKRRLQAGNFDTRNITQHKRHASNNLCGRQAKRSRFCTYIVDEKIDSMEAEKKSKTDALKNEMNNQINLLDRECFREELNWKNNYYDPYQYNYYPNYFNRVRQEILHITNKYIMKANECAAQYESKVNALKKVREEIFQFYNFYRGLGDNENEDPTFVTESQLQELDEIENIYAQFEKYYRK